MNIDRFRINRNKVRANKTPGKETSLPCHTKGERFLKGPIPLKWLSLAAKQPGKALHVSIVLWHMAGMKRSRTIALSNGQLSEFGISRRAKYDNLKVLNKVGLISVKQLPGRSPIVTLLDNKI